MTTLFTTILDMSMTATVVALAIIFVRLLLKKAPKIFSYALWSAVLFRLVFPFSIESVFSLMPIFINDLSQDTILSQNQITQTTGTTQNVVTNGVLSTVTTHANFIPSTFGIIGLIWFLGFVVMMAYAIIGYLRLKKRVKFATLISDNIFETDKIKTPFVLGFIRPKIYFPVNIDPSQYDYVLKHEQTHIKRFDYLIKPFAYVLLALHWFNPVIWFSYFLMSKDMEMSCDEAILKKETADIRRAYSYSLLNLSTDKNNLLSPISFGANHVKERVKNVLNFKKTKMWLTAISIIVVTFVLVACSLNPTSESDTGLVITNNSMVMNDDDFSGTEIHTVALSSGNTVRINTYGNALDISIIHESGEPVWLTGEGMSTTSSRGMSVGIAEGGEHIITVEGNGRFSISW